MKLILILIVLLFPFAITAQAQDLNGAPLPKSIPQEVYERVLGNEPTDPDGCLAHWVAAGSGVDRWVELLESEPEAPAYSPPVEIPVAAPCSKVVPWNSDSGLWKPTSENFGRPVILLPCEYNAAKEIVVLGPTPETTSSVRSRNYCKNGNRSHFDVNLRASQLAQNSVVAIRFADNSVECRLIPNPNQRY